MPRSLADRIRAHEQHKARLAEQEAKLKEDTRKDRNRRLFRAGGLVDKAGLLDLESNALYGALLSLRDGVHDPAQVERWTTLGGRTFAREKQLEDEGKELVIATFPGPLGKPAAVQLRIAGLRFNRLMQHWEGRAHFTEVEEVARTCGGKVQRVAAHAAADEQREAAE
jgi:hypothetical protein